MDCLVVCWKLVKRKILGLPNDGRRLQVLKNTTVLYVLILYWCVNENDET